VVESGPKSANERFGGGGRTDAENHVFVRDGRVTTHRGIKRMASSFGVVEDKLREAEFFLAQLSKTSRLSFEADCFFSAFVSATRSVTFAMQASLKGVPGFKEWYDIAQKKLKTDPAGTVLRGDKKRTGSYWG
jgi:hypothetical protein